MLFSHLTSSAHLECLDQFHYTSTLGDCDCITSNTILNFFVSHKLFCVNHFQESDFKSCLRKLIFLIEYSNGDKETTIPWNMKVDLGAETISKYPNWIILGMGHHTKMGIKEKRWILLDLAKMTWNDTETRLFESDTNPNRLDPILI